MSAIDDFLIKYRPMAEIVSKETGIPVERILAQAGHETGWNVNTPGNNFFGIKAQPGYQGNTQTLNTTEDFGNGLQNVRQRFRAYDDPTDSFRDWAKVIGQDNFKSAMEPGISDAEYAQRLAAGGYATDPAYADKLAKSIASTRAALGSPEGVTVLANGQPQNIGLAPNVTNVAQDDGGIADDAALRARGNLAAQAAVNSIPAGGVPPAGGAVARANPFSLGGMVRNGLALMSAGAGQPPRPLPVAPIAMPAPAPVHRPDMQGAPSLMDLISPRRNPYSLIG